MTLRSCCSSAFALVGLLACNAEAPQREVEPEHVDAKDASDAAAFGVVFEEIPLAGADFVTDFEFVPRRDELLVSSKEGVIHHLALEDDSTRLLGQVQLELVYDELDCGLISVALDPDFDDNRFVYLGFCTDVRTSGVYRITWSENYDEVAPSLTEIISVGAPRVAPENERPWHNVGAIDFSDDGVLWVTFGDKVRSESAQDPNSQLGALLRIVPNREPAGSGHTPPADNPFAAGGGDPSVYATGLRSPWRGTLDQQGRYFVGDVGSDFFEEVDMIDEPGQNLGWPISEGPCERDCEGLVDPVTSWSRELDHPYVLDDPDANPINPRVVNVGVEYVDLGNDRYAGRLSNRIIFGDACVGWIRALEVDEERNVVHDQHIGHLNHVSSWRQGADGYLYVTTYGRCQTDRANPSDAPSRLYRVLSHDRR